MKKVIISLIILFIYQGCFSQIVYDSNFTNKGLLINYLREGSCQKDTLIVKEFKQTPIWAGPTKNLIDNLNLGEYRISVFDAEKNKLIYSKTYSTIFYEWITVCYEPNKKRSFQESIVIPFPKKKVKIVFEKDTGNHFIKQAEIYFDPQTTVYQKKLKFNFDVDTLVFNGSPTNHVDIVFLAEKYTKAELDSFKKDVLNSIKFQFKRQPFKKYKKSFNIYVINSYSEEKDGKIISPFYSHFHTFGIERYLTVDSIWNVYEAANLAPADQIIIAVNTKKYGGGGFYNFLNLYSAKHFYADLIYLHEFGHSFGGLADEYGYTDPETEHFHKLYLEPKAPNITTLVDFDKKWKNLVSKKTPIPTPIEQKYAKKIGVFEGAGYRNHGIYRPAYTCIMRTLSTDKFCKVCQISLEEVIKYWKNQ